MSINKFRKIEFYLAPGVTLRIGRSQVVVRFRFPRGSFEDYLADKLKTVPPDIYDTVGASDHDIELPNGLLRDLAYQIDKYAVACATREDDAPTS